MSTGAAFAPPPDPAQAPPRRRRMTKDYGPDEIVPVVIGRGGTRFEADGVPVREILRNSMNPEAE